MSGLSRRMAVLSFISQTSSRGGNVRESEFSEGKMRRMGGFAREFPATSDRVIIRAVRHGTERSKIPARKGGDRANSLLSSFPGD